MAVGQASGAGIPEFGPESQLWQSFPALHLVRTTWWIRAFGRFTIGLLVVGLISMIFVPWQQTARGTGRVVALDPQERPQTQTSPYEGIVKVVQAGLREGSYVRRGEIIMELEPFAADAVAQLESQINQLQLKLESSKTNLELARLNISTQQQSGQSLIDSLEREVEAARKKWEQQQREVEVLESEYAQKTYESRQAEELYPKGLISEQELLKKRNDQTQAFSKLNKGEAMVLEFFASLSAKEDQVESKRQEIYIKNREAETKEQDEIQKLATTQKDLTDLLTKRGELDRLTITAPRDGYLAQVFGLEGSNTVKKGDQLFTVVPDTTSLAVEIRITGRDMPLVHKGDKVRLQFEGWPAVQFVGWPSTAIGTFGGEIKALSPTDDSKGYFSALVVPDQQNPAEPDWPDNRYLRQGVRANGWVLLKQVPLGYEIWRLLNGFPPIVAEDEPKDSAKPGTPKLPK